MKRFLYFTTISALLFSCNPTENPGGENKGEETSDSISLSTDKAEFASSSGETKQIEVTASGEWSVSGYTEGVQQWLLADIISGKGNDTVSISSIELNPYDTKRMAVLVFKCGKASASLLVQQYPDPERTISLSADQVDFSGPLGETETVNVVTAKAWTLEEYPDEVKSWLSISPESGTSGAEITLKTLDINEDILPREARVCFSIDRVNKAWLTITQAPGLELSVDNDHVHLDFEAGSKSVLSIHSNSKTKDWRIIADEIPSWLSFSKTSGRGDASVEITALSRNDGLVKNAAFSLVLDELHSLPFTVEQGSSLEIHVTPSSLTFPALVPGQKEVVVSATTDALTWTLQGYTDEVKTWLSVDTDSFSGLEKIVKISTLDVNMDTEPRIATLRFQFTEGVYADLSIVQEGVKIVDKVIEVNFNSTNATESNSHPDVMAFEQPWNSVDRTSVANGTLVVGKAKKKTVVTVTEGGTEYQIWATHGYARNMKAASQLGDIWFNYYDLNRSVSGQKWDCGSPNGYAWIRFPEFNGTLYKLEIQIMSASEGPFCLATAVDPETGEAKEIIETVATTKKSAFDWVIFNLTDQEANTPYYICMGDGYSYRVRSWKLYYKAYE